MTFYPPRAFQTARKGSFTIRTALPEDEAAVIAYARPRIAEEEFFIIVPEEFDKTAEQEREWLQGCLEAPGKLILVAEADGAVIAMLNFENGPRRRIAHRGTFGISVAPAWRRQGVATALIQTLIAWGQEQTEIEKLCLSVYATNHGAIALYRKLGFAEEGRCPKAIKLGPGRYADELLMYRFVNGPRE